MIEILYGTDEKSGQLDVGHIARDGVPICGSEDHKRPEMFSFIPDGVADLSAFLTCRKCWGKVKAEIVEFNKKGEKKAEKKSTEKKEGN